MATPDPIGPIRFDEPRAVKIREPEDLNAFHTTISARIHVYVDTKVQADAILANWNEIIQAAADAAASIISDVSSG